MADIVVTGNQLSFNGKTYRCAIGKGGFSEHKKEGDGATPIGVFLLRECWYRADKTAKPKTLLPLQEILQTDGWCDDPKSQDYNRLVELPYDCSHEKLFREDDMYDLIMPLGYNDDTVEPGKGSAIFIHVAREYYEPTEGCVALAKVDLLEILKNCSAQTCIEIKQ